MNGGTEAIMAHPPGKYALPSLEEATVQYLTDSSKHYALANGILKRVNTSLDSSEVVTYVPHTLFPSPLPRRLYQEANELQDDINILMMKIANDNEFLVSTLKSTVTVDDFTSRLFQMYQQVRNEALPKPISMCVVRPDYMVDTTGDELAFKMVEINTIAAGMGGIGMQVADLHSYNVSLCREMHAELAGNKAVMTIGEGAAKAWELYGQPNAWVLFLVSTKEYNIFDHCWLEHTIRRFNPAIRILRRTLTQLGQEATLTEDRRLMVDDKEIAFVYFRIGYAPAHYPTEKEWNARLMIERSRAVACPSINWHLAGTKKIQQELSVPGVLERFLDDPRTIARIRQTFVRQYDLTLTKEGDEAAALGIKNPEKYVLKPQREGGGNNLYDEDLKRKLEELSGKEERGAFILMEKIYGQVFKNYEIKGPGPANLCDMVTEYGPFGVLLSHEGKILLNKTTGYYMKSHNINLTEGGISIGSAAMDSVAFT